MGGGPCGCGWAGDGAAGLGRWEASCAPRCARLPPPHPTPFPMSKDGWREKETRARIKSEVERGIRRRRVLVLDSLNTIKGYRYEIYCIARAAAVRYCMVHVDSGVEACRAWNATRAAAGGAAWAEPVFADLASRYERPDSRQRWDAPLFTVRPDREDRAEVDARLQAVLAHALDLAQSPAGRTDTGAGCDGCADAGPPAVPPSRALAPTMATSNAKLSCEDGAWAVHGAVALRDSGRGLFAPAGAGLNPCSPARMLPVRHQPPRARFQTPTIALDPAATNLLHDIDRATNEVLEAISSAQAARPGAAPGLVGLGEGVPPLRMHRQVSAADREGLRGERAGGCRGQRTCLDQEEGCRSASSAVQQAQAERAGSAVPAVLAGWAVSFGRAGGPDPDKPSPHPQLSIR